MVSRHWLYFGGSVIAAVLLVAAGLLGLLDALSVLSGGTAYGEEFVLLAMLGEAAEWLVIALVLGLLAAALLVASVVSILRSASLPRSDRLVALVERLEREYPILRTFDVSEKVEPTREDRKREIRDRYVAGELSEAEFEREMERVLDDDSTADAPRSGTETERRR